MPQLLNVPLYQPMQPYYYDVDNMPILALMQNDTIINAQTDYNSKLLNDAIGSAGSLAARLNTSMDDMGNLTQAAVDATYHHLADHSDVNGAPLSAPTNDYFVMMLDSERSRLANMSDYSTAFSLTVTPGTVSSPGIAVNFNNLLNLIPSSSINWLITQSGGQNYIAAESTFGGAYHQHIYGETPTTVNYTNYTVLSGSYSSGTLRVYINGVRVNLGSPGAYVPSHASSPTWGINYFSETNSSLGTFQLYVSITSSDVIRVDYDMPIS